MGSDLNTEEPIIKPTNSDIVNCDVLGKEYITDDLSDVNFDDLPEGRGNLMSRVKKARQKAIRDAVEKEMTEDERLREQRAASDMLAR